MKIVAGETLCQGEVRSNRAVGTVPKVLGLNDGRVLTTCRVGLNVHVHACVVSVAIDSGNRALH